jgi:hypothetical protein
MAIVYDIFVNDGLGGPIDYDTPIASGVTGTSYSTAPLTAPGDYLIGIRTRDTASGLVDLNVDAVVPLKIAADGTNITARPNLPTNLTVRATAAGTALVRWTYSPAGQGGAPQTFRVYLGSPAIDYGDPPEETVAYAEGLPSYSATISGLVHGTVYQVGVRSVNASGEEANTATASVTGQVAGPDPVEGLTITAVSGD